MKKIAILGGTGFIGKHLINELVNDFKITVLTRSPEKYKHLAGKNIELIKVDYANANDLASIFSRVQGVINLTGESVSSRWTKANKEKIYNSRILTSKAIADAFKLAKEIPPFLIQGSAIGIYGKTNNDPNEAVTEASIPLINGYLPKVSSDNENAVKKLHEITRVVYLRTGIVLGTDGGALPQMALPYKFFVGGPIGSGMQWNSWIHIHDEVRAIKFLIQNERLEGAFNLTAPNPITNTEMSKAIAKSLNKTSFMHTPGFLLKIIFGEMADEILLNGLRVIPQRLIDTGFSFNYETIDTALNDIFR